MNKRNILLGILIGLVLLIMGCSENEIVREYELTVKCQEWSSGATWCEFDDGWIQIKVAK